MSTDFADRAPLLRDPEAPLQPARPDHWPMVPTALVSVFALFILASFILFACHRIAEATASPPSTWQRSQHVPPPPPAALCPEAVAALPLVRARAGQKLYCCAVCLAEYEERERVKLMPVCGHVFHPDCIDTWLFSHGSCPVCRCSDISGSRTGDQVRLDVFEREGEGEGEEEVVEHDSLRKIRRNRSCGSGVERELEGNGFATVFLQRSCSF